MRNFVVRVYRSYPEDKSLVSGVVEDIESGQKVVFHNFDDLQSLLGEPLLTAPLHESAVFCQLPPHKNSQIRQSPWLTAY
jgi:hypothetical protein